MTQHLCLCGAPSYGLALCGWCSSNLREIKILATKKWSERNEN
jgi:hypothetical protein